METDTTLRELQKEFVGIGVYSNLEFVQICVRNRAFCYEVNAGGQIYYHVFKRVENPRFGVVSYPGSEAFGKRAWCYRNLEHAIEKFNSLQNN